MSTATAQTAPASDRPGAQARMPVGRWTLFGPHHPLNPVAWAGERVADGHARATKTRATQLLSSEIDQPLGALARPAMRRAFFIPR